MYMHWTHIKTYSSLACVSIDKDEMSSDAKSSTFSNNLLIAEPWLNEIIDPLSCGTGDAVDIYRSGSSHYYLIRHGNSNALYNEDGIKYCEDISYGIYQDFFYLSEKIYTWTCGDDISAQADYSALAIDFAM